MISLRCDAITGWKTAKTRVSMCKESLEHLKLCLSWFCEHFQSKVFFSPIECETKSLHTTRPKALYWIKSKENPSNFCHFNIQTKEHKMTSTVTHWILSLVLWAVSTHNFHQENKKWGKTQTEQSFLFVVSVSWWAKVFQSEIPFPCILLGYPWISNLFRNKCIYIQIVHV